MNSENIETVTRILIEQIRTIKCRCFNNYIIYKGEKMTTEEKLKFEPLDEQTTEELKELIKDFPINKVELIT